jgi:hypothetical protein
MTLETMDIKLRATLEELASESERLAEYWDRRTKEFKITMLKILAKDVSKLLEIAKAETTTAAK